MESNVEGSIPFVGRAFALQCVARAQAGSLQSDTQYLTQKMLPLQASPLDSQPVGPPSQEDLAYHGAIS